MDIIPYRPKKCDDRSGKMQVSVTSKLFTGSLTVIIYCLHTMRVCKYCESCGFREIFKKNLCLKLMMGNTRHTFIKTCHIYI